MQLSVGDFIKKKNNLPFGRGENMVPIIAIEHIKQDRWGGLSINNDFQIKPRDVEVITEEEANKLANVFNSCQITHIRKPGLNTSCFRLDNGESKVKWPIDTNSYVSILFKQKITRPTEGFEAHICDNCGFVHIGRSNPAVSEPILL